MSLPSIRNLFAEVPDELREELVERLASSEHVRIERIVSRKHASPEGFWYEEPEHEWVMVLQGAAGLVFEGEAAVLELRVGDSLVIPAHRRHRVAWTENPTIWLAVHYR